MFFAGGKTTTHALGLLEPRGTLFTGIQQEVYGGMIIGECSRDGEMEVSLSARLLANQDQFPALLVPDC